MAGPYLFVDELAVMLVDELCRSPATRLVIRRCEGEGSSLDRAGIDARWFEWHAVVKKECDRRPLAETAT